MATLLLFGTLLLTTRTASAQSRRTQPQSQALPDRGAVPPDPAALFEALDTSRTGIEFAHHWAPPSEHEDMISSSFTAAGVCIGDYDGDGRPDVFLTRSFGGSRLYRNRGDLQFEDVTEKAGLGSESSWDTGPTFVDVDNDGDLDLYVCRYDHPNGLYMNQGDGTFVEGAANMGLGFAGASITMAFADYDLDGDLDAYLLTNHLKMEGLASKVQVRQVNGRWTVAEALHEFADVLTRPDGSPDLIRAGQEDRLYRNNGDSTFTDVTHEAGISGADLGLSATWWDYNGDQLPDLYVANDFKGADQLYRNDGNGRFTNVVAKAVPHTPWYSMGADTSDINNDGRIDLLVGDMSSTTHYKAKLSMGDMEDLGWFLEYPTPRQYMRNSFFLNSGTDRFMEIAHLAGLSSSDWTWAVKFGDLDNDGWVDVFFTNGMTRYWMNSDYARTTQNKIGLEFREVMSDWVRRSPRRDEANLAFRNLGNLRFEKMGGAWGLDHVGVSYGAALGDLDNDGDLDLVVNHLDEPVSVYRNSGVAGHRIKLRLEGSVSNRWGVGATVHCRTSAGLQTRYLTLSRGFMSADEPLVHFGTGADERIERLIVQWPSGHVQEFNDLTSDRFYTITEPSVSTTERDSEVTEPMFDGDTSPLRWVLHREQPYDDFTHQPLLPNKLSQLGPGLAWADVDGDGDDDLYVGGPAGQLGMLRVNMGKGRFRGSAQPAFTTDAAVEDMAALFFDSDGDGDQDLFVVSGSVECEAGDAVLRDRLYLNDGSGKFVGSPDELLPLLHDSGSVVTAADFDRDGDLDLFVGGRSVPGAYPITPNSRLLINEQGRFSDRTNEVAPGLRETGLVTSALWSDTDDDGDQDLLVTHEWGPIKLWRNDQGRLVDKTQAAGLSQKLGWWNGIAARDIDNDGDIDYAVTNIGLNTKYHATVEKPVLLYYGDFDGSGKRCLVEAEFEDETLFPVRGKSCSTHAMPHLGEKFTTFHDFALASLSDIYTPGCLQNALRLEANTFESGLLLNDGCGRFEFIALPELVQVSPGFGVVLTEVDGDGNADLYVVHNFFAAQRETGRMDGGLSLLLFGDGDGGFTPVWPDRSGLVVPGDAKGLAAADLNDDGWVDFVVGVNNGMLKVFVNRGRPDHRVIKVRLRGRAGNPTAVGARVTLVVDGGWSQTAEVHAGGGYLSQSSRDLVFGLGPNGRLQAITVRWPAGEISTATPTIHESMVVLEHPAR